MALSDIPLFGMLRERMHWVQARQGVLSQNVANAHTPGYAAQDVREFNFRDALKSTTSGQLHMASTRAGHLSGSATSMATRGDVKTESAPDSETSANGNSVVLEEQMMKVAENQMDYQTATTLYTKGLGMLRMAVTGRSQA
ncbi:flagellar basal body rod protein FlgB [Pyruvatibacter mobilis]|uniref:flagellar basal body rod protein FlgB n=1 Tax=Pyruvatibacter mobilis TaxID=1712261 RepID=UPI003BAC0142